MTPYLPRDLTGRASRALRTMPVVAISGLRQTGKSTMMQREPALARGRAYSTLDDFPTLAAARSNPESLLGRRIALDEVQRCPDLLLAIKQQVDADRRPGQFLLSGSANLLLLEKVSESLAGRAVFLTLHPMTRREIASGCGREPFLARFLRRPHLPADAAKPVADREVLMGGLPPACLARRPEDAAEWFRGYTQTYVERDIRQLAQVADLVAFRTVAQLTALRTGQVLVTSSLARDAHLSPITVTRYLGLLEAGFLIRRLPAFSSNRSSRLVKSAKCHITDSGLAAHLAGVTDLSPGRDDLLRGALYETYVLQNAAAILEAHLPDARLSYWSEHGRHEVDLVIEVTPATVWALEIKASTRWAERDLTSLRAFTDRTPTCAGAILAYNGTHAAQLGPKLWAIPLGLLLQ